MGEYKYTSKKIAAEISQYLQQNPPQLYSFSELADLLDVPLDVIRRAKRKAFQGAGIGTIFLDELIAKGKEEGYIYFGPRARIPRDFIYLLSKEEAAVKSWIAKTMFKSKQTFNNISQTEE